MRELLILLLIGGVGYLAYDDYYVKRDALKQAQDEIQRLSQDRPAAARATGTTGVTVWNPSTPGWMQNRLSERPAMDEPVRQTRDAKYYPTPTPH
jgi:hypothetical protein